MKSPYTPQQNGIMQAAARRVRYDEIPPQVAHARYVYCLWELKTTQPLAHNFYYTILPDACIDIVFDLGDCSASIMTPRQTAWRIVLGRRFHYVGIRLHPGVYHGDVDAVVGMAIPIKRLAGWAVTDIIASLRQHSFTQQQDILATCIQRMIDCSLVQEDDFIMQVIARLDGQHTITQIAQQLGCSERHLRRIVRQRTGFSPQALRTIVQFQRSFTEDWRELYADQSHYIHRFQWITQHTPQRYHKTYQA